MLMLPRRKHRKGRGWQRGIGIWKWSKLTSTAPRIISRLAIWSSKISNWINGDAFFALLISNNSTTVSSSFCFLSAVFTCEKYHSATVVTCVILERFANTVSAAVYGPLRFCHLMVSNGSDFSASSIFQQTAACLLKHYSLTYYIHHSIRTI